MPEGDDWRIRMAISARGIINNDLSYILSPNGAFPKLIWYPSVAASSTYEALARLIPRMRPDVARAAIFANYQQLFDSLIAGDGGDPVEPTYELLNEARRSHNVHYRETLERKAKELGLDITKGGPWPDALVQDLPQYKHFFDTNYPARLPGIGISRREHDSIYNDMACNASYVETYISIPEEWRRAPEGYEPEDGITHMELDYVRWPPGFQKRHSEGTQ